MVTRSLLLAALAAAAIGCQAQPAEWPELGGTTTLKRQPAGKGLRVLPQRNRSVAQLSAGDVITIMKAIGCTDEQILSLGPDLRDALGMAGGARLMLDNKTRAIFRVDDQHVFVMLASEGVFVYDLVRHQFGLTSASPQDLM
jgi:hypothetical protein